MATRSKQPLISITMPVYNAEAHLEEAILSILRQTYKNFELIIVNDGSTDKSQDIIDTYSKLDSRIKAFKQPNKGVVAASSFAIKKSIGEFITRHDADDISFPTKLDDFVYTLNVHPNAIVITGNIEVINERGEFIRKDFTPPNDTGLKTALLVYNPLPNGATLIKKSAFEEVGGYSDVFAEDLDLWIKLYDKGEFASTESFVYKWRINSSGLTSSNAALTITKEREYTGRLWATALPPVLSRNEILRESHALLEKDHGEHYKSSYLYALSRIGTRLIKRRQIALGAMQLLFIMSTGRTGMKIALKQIFLSAKGVFK